MYDIKPIETIYNGYCFRSRLEAKWAVFFDNLDIEYIYEPDGFDLGDGIYYLPDFYLPQFDLFVEIKPFDRNVVKHVGDYNPWEAKCRRFRDVTDRAILLCYNEPAADVWKYLFTFDTTDSGGAGDMDIPVMFVEFCGKVVLCASPGRDRTLYTRGFDSGLKENDRVGVANKFIDDEYLALALWRKAMLIYPDEYAKDPSVYRMYQAKNNSRQARFEHGKTPSVNKGDNQ